MRPSTKHGAAENNRSISGHVLTLHKRLYHALNLGCRSWEHKSKWHCSDIETQKLVVRSIEAFLDCISIETLRHPLVKDSIVDMLTALDSILEHKSRPILRLASNVAVKMVNILPSSMLQSHVSDLVRHLADLLSSQELQVVISCTTALNSIISKIHSRRDREVLKILEETKAVGYLVHNINEFCVDDKPIEYFREMASLLSKILWLWPTCRFNVWNDFKFLNVLNGIKLMSDNSLKVAVLQLYSTLALCALGAEKLLENGDALLQMMVCCMDSSYTEPVRMAAFKLARCLALSRRGCVQMMSVCGEPLVRAVISAMKDGNLLSEKLSRSQMPVMEEACRLACITRWPGDHHVQFWEAGVDRLLMDLLLYNYDRAQEIRLASSMGDDDLIKILQESLSSNLNLSLRPYLWDILGGLIAHFPEKKLTDQSSEPEFRLKILILCACSVFSESIATSRLTYTSESESSARAVLTMVYSPCKNIASLARSSLYEVLKLKGKNHVEHSLETLKERFSGNPLILPGNLQTVVSLLILLCLSTLQKSRNLIIKCQGIETLVTFIRWWLKNPVRIERASIVPHLHDPLSERSCCFLNNEEWEGKDMLLVYSLWVLSELLHHYGPKKNHQPEFDEAFIQELEEICRGTNSPGSKWCAGYILCYFGVYGFPSKLGKRIGKALGEADHADLKLDLVNHESVYVHEVILMTRCPSLLPPRESENLIEIKSVSLSTRVDRESLLKLLEYVYLGYLQSGEELVKMLKIIAKRCKLEALVQMLYRTRPKWDTPVPSFDLSPALGPSGYYSSNLVLESNTTQLNDWKCNSCSASVPHLHVHKVVLWSSCDYLCGLFRSGMQESHLQTIKAPVNWESLNKLVTWFYSDHLPKPKFDCLWKNMDPEQKFREIQPYVELCWLAEFWLIGDLHQECYEIVVSSLKYCVYLSTKVIQIAAELSQPNLAEIAANYTAPFYHQLRNSGTLDGLDENLREMIRVASVRLSREGTHHSS